MTVNMLILDSLQHNLNKKQGVIINITRYGVLRSLLSNEIFGHFGIGDGIISKQGFGL